MTGSSDVKYRERRFIAGGIIALISLVSLRFFVIPHLAGEPVPSITGMLTNITDNLIIALVASLTITFLVIWLVPQKFNNAIIEIVDPIMISEALNDAHKTTHEWWYKGDIGRHFRSVTLPKLASGARAENMTKHVTLLILDPTRINDYYNALHHSRLRSSTKLKDDLSPKQVQLELNATIVSVYIMQDKEPLLDIDVGLLNKHSTHRLDLSSRLVLLSVADPQAPVIRANEDTFYYRAFREELIVSKQQALILNKKVKGVSIDHLTIETVRELLHNLNLDNQELSDFDIEEIIRLVKKARNPYA